MTLGTSYNFECGDISTQQSREFFIKKIKDSKVEDTHKEAV